MVNYLKYIVILNLNVSKYEVSNKGKSEKRNSKGKTIVKEFNTLFYW